VREMLTVQIDMLLVRHKYCDMMPKGQNDGAREMSITRQRLGNRVSSAKNATPWL
jgi:hypothetical protein